AGETEKSITLNIENDQIFEATEQFFVNLSNEVNATIAKSQGTGTILDNDAVSGNTISDTVEEDDLDNAQSVGHNEDGSVGMTVATGSVTSLFNSGEPLTYCLSSDSSSLTSQNLTSKGIPLDYTVNASGDLLTAT